MPQQRKRKRKIASIYFFITEPTVAAMSGVSGKLARGVSLGIFFFFFFFFFLLLLLLDIATSNADSFVSSNQKRNVQQHHEVLIGYKNERGRTFLSNTVDVRHRRSPFQLVNAIPATIESDQIQLLEQNPDIAYVEDDSLVHLLGLLGEIQPYGISMIQAEFPVAPLQQKDVLPQSTDHSNSACQHDGGPCDDPNSFRIGLIDSGVDVNHPDLVCSQNGHCIGSEFKVHSTWSDPDDSHGTFVMGIISAIRDNDLGIQGVLSQGRSRSSVCTVVARVFDSTQEAAGGARLSDILEAIEWAAITQRAHVINLSLGTPVYSSTTDKLLQRLYDSGVLMVAAAGNFGSSGSVYPASYESVVSVAAVDAALQHASFSERNAQVELAAPGEDIFSTVPMGMGSLATLVVIDELNKTNVVTLGGIVLSQMNYSNSIAGSLVDCSYDQACRGSPSGNMVCVLASDLANMEQRIGNCESMGGVAALMYKVEDEMPIINATTNSTIPLIGLSHMDGATILEGVRTNSTVQIGFQDGLSLLSGTSFAAPYVSGVAAAIWQSCPACTNKDVRFCMQVTARDLGQEGRDNEYGYGLVQMKDAYACLTNEVMCCTNSSSAESRFESCKNLRMSSTEAIECDACLNSVVSILFADQSCDTMSLGVCSAFSSLCSACDACRHELMFSLTTTVYDSTGCVVTCSENASSCLAAWEDMRQCLNDYDDDDIAFKEECEDSCFYDAIIASFESCYDSGGKSFLCTNVRTCGCERCHPLVDQYVGCLSHHSVGGCNRVVCPSSSASDIDVRSHLSHLEASVIILTVLVTLLVEFVS